MKGIQTRLGVLAVAITALTAAVGLTASPALAGPATADVVRLPIPQYDGTLTPYTFEIGYPVMTLAYDTLMWRDTGGVPQPWLARSITRSRAGRRVTVSLRPGVRWHDGRPLTAADVVFTFRFVAARFQPRFTPQLRNLERVRATGELTVAFDLRQPSIGFDDQPLSDVPILPAHLWRDLPAEKAAPDSPPIGSGPYRIDGSSPKSGYVLRANRSYFRGVPRVREIRMPIIDDAERTFEALRDRRVDIVPLSLPPRAAENLGGTIGIGVRRGPSYSGTTLLLNLRRPPFDDPATRRAVAAALDLGRIVRNVAPAVAAVQGQIHPASRWAGTTPVQRPDLPAARRTLAAAGRAPIRVLAPVNDPVRTEAGRQVVLALRRAGGQASLVKLSRVRLGQATGEDGSAPDFDAAIQSIPALASADPDYLRTQFGSDALNAPLNASGYRSEEFDALAQRVASAPDMAARQTAVNAELALLARDLPSIPLFFSQGTFAFRPAIYDGWVFVKGTGILDKRSFVPGETLARSTAAPNAAAAAEQAAAADTNSGSESGLSTLNLITIVVLAIVVLLAGAAILQRRSSDRP